MPPHSSTDVYAAAMEISTSLMHLRHEHRVAKRHMNLIEELIDEHQTKIDVLMQLVVNGMGVTFQQPNSTVSHPQSCNNEPQSLIPAPSVPHTIPASLTDQRNCTTSVSTSNPTWSTSPSLFEQGNTFQLPVADQQFIIESSSSTDFKKDTSEPLIELEQPIYDDRLPKDFVPSTSTAVPDNQGNELMKTNKQKQPLKRHRQTARNKRVVGNNKSIPVVPKTTSRKSDKISKVQSGKVSGDKSVVDIPESSYSVEAARRRDKNGKLYYECGCGRLFPLVCSFKRHVMFKHTFEKPYKCNYCSYASAMRSHVVDHQRRRHS